MNKPAFVAACVIAAGCLASGARAEIPGTAAYITTDLPRVTVLQRGKPVVIERNPDTANMIEPDFALTSRPCPPFCILP